MLSLLVGCIRNVLRKILRDAVEEALHKKGLQIVSMETVVVADKLLVLQLADSDAVHNFNKERSLRSSLKQLTGQGRR